MQHNHTSLTHLVYELGIICVQVLSACASAAGTDALEGSQEVGSAIGAYPPLALPQTSVMAEVDGYGWHDCE